MSYYNAERTPGMSGEEEKRLDAAAFYGLSGQDLDDFLAEEGVIVEEATPVQKNPEEV